MFVYGTIAVILGLIWDLFFPINKALWTSSFVLYAGGLATIGLSISYWLIDVQGYKRFTPFFVAFGANAITAYILADFIPHYLSMIRGDDAVILRPFSQIKDDRGLAAYALRMQPAQDRRLKPHDTRAPRAGRGS